MNFAGVPCLFSKSLLNRITHIIPNPVTCLKNLNEKLRKIFTLSTGIRNCAVNILCDMCIRPALPGRFPLCSLYMEFRTVSDQWVFEVNELSLLSQEVTFQKLLSAENSSVCSLR